MKTAVIYARYSSDNQTEQSIEGQLHVCQEYAKSHNILILDSYIDRAMTGTNDNRPDFKRMLKDSAKKRWDYVLVYKLDRFSRNKYEATIHKHTLKQNGVKLLSAMENIPDTPEGIILESLLEGMNQYYSAELAQKVKRGMRETRLKGFYQGGTLCYGYRIEGRKIVIDDFQANIVRYIYSEYAKGVYVRTIIRNLTEQGVLFKGKPFSLNVVYGILKNDKYSGVYYHGEEKVENMYPRILSDELFDKVRKIVDSNRYGKRSIKTVYLFRNKIKCGYCGLPIGAETGTSGCGKVVSYYKCSGRKRNSGCQKANVRKETLEKVITNIIISEFSKKETMDQIVDKIMKMQEKGTGKNAILLHLKKEKESVEKALNNLVKAIEQGIISETTARRLHELEKQQTELERRFLMEQNKSAIRLSEANVRDYYREILKQNIPAIIQLMIKEIILFDDRAEIYLNSPLNDLDAQHQGCFLFAVSGSLRYRKRNCKGSFKQNLNVLFYLP